jgi:hypothetical protein
MYSFEQHVHLQHSCRVRYERNASGSFIKISCVNSCFGCSIEQQKHLKEQVQELDDGKIGKCVVHG